MGGRGRGGGGRGRGRGGMSIDVSQLGFGAGEAIPGPVLQPPPTFPVLDHRPAPLKTEPEGEYMLALKREFIDYLRGSFMFLQPQETVSSIERFSDKYRSTNNSAKDDSESKFDWKRLPKELNPAKKLGKRKSATPNLVKKASEDVTQKLEKLAKMEKSKEDDDSETENKETEEKDEDDEEHVEEDAEDLDDEMDMGTDYLNNYFDNGEDEDEDDNMDDGPVY